MYKSKYASLHDHVVGAYDREKQLLKKAKTLHQDLLAERISSEKLSIRRVEDAQLVADLQKEKDKAERELQAAQEKEGEAKWESEKAHVRGGAPSPRQPPPLQPHADHTHAGTRWLGAGGGAPPHCGPEPDEERERRRGPPRLRCGGEGGERAQGKSGAFPRG